MPGESDLPDFHDPLLVPEQWVMEYEARLRAAASPNPVQTELDSLNSLEASAGVPKTDPFHEGLLRSAGFKDDDDLAKKTTMLQRILSVLRRKDQASRNSRRAR